MVTLSPNLRVMVKRVFQATPNGTGGVVLEELCRDFTATEIEDGWKILLNDKRLFERYSDTPFKLEQGFHVVRLTPQGRVSAQEIIQHDDQAERERITALNAVAEAEAESRRIQKRGRVFTIINIIVGIGNAILTPLIVNHYDRKIERWEERQSQRDEQDRVKSVNAATMVATPLIVPTTAPTTQP